MPTGIYGKVFVMKRKIRVALISCLILLVSVFVFAACGNEDTETPHMHNEIIDPMVAPTCTTSGFTEGKHCSVCNEVLVAQTVVDALGHVEVIDPAISPTCIEPGLTAGMHCSICNEVIKEQNFIKPFGHTEVADEAVIPTCTQTGLTKGKHCSVCNETLITQETISELGHNVVVDATVSATCTTNGLTEGKHCSRCNEVLVAQNTINALGHSEVVDSAIKPTCTTNGLTEGKHCSVCNEVLIVQTVIDALGHIEVIDEAVAPDCTNTGLTQGKHCSVCEKVFVDQMIVDALGHSYNAVDILPTCTLNGYTVHTCHCGDNYVDNSIGAFGHSEVTDAHIDPTCVSGGLTMGKHCSICNEILVEQKVIDALGHNVVDRTCTVCGNEVASEGFSYELSSDGTYYIVSGIGICTVNDIIIPSVYNGLPVRSIGTSAFQGCKNLTSVSIPDSVTSIEPSAFGGCTGLTSITIPDSVISIGNEAFGGCYNLTSLTIGNNVTSIGSYAFINCSSLTNVLIPDSVISICSYVFGYCTSLTNVTIGDSLLSIGFHAFDYCYSLENITIPDSVTSIGEYAFSSCYGLKNITISDSVTSIGSYAFWHCSALTSIYFEATIGQWNTIEKDSNLTSDDTAYIIYCSNGEIRKDCTVYADAYVRSGDYIYFGEYPQTIKADNVTISSTTDERGYYLGSDGYYYAKVVATPYGYRYQFSSGDTVTSGEIYYFKVEPIRWRIIEEENGTAFILCDSIIANGPYQSDSFYYDGKFYTNANGSLNGYQNNYKYSEVRAWLNATFYKIAFSELQREIILETIVDNSSKSTGLTYNPCACENTQDKIFLLSYIEVTNYLKSTSNKIMICSDYSRATGVAMRTDSDASYGWSSWWLRSPNDDNGQGAKQVDSSGNVFYSNGAKAEHMGIVPAMWIAL